jgi:phosphatidylserine/phosphatidylglycerophosphate/cardiolipin synthase-like enzyme
VSGAGVPAARGGSYPLRPGNAVRALVDGEPAFRRICEAVEAARESVFVTVAYIDR